MMTDLNLIEQTRVNRTRLTGAFLLGPAARARGRVPLLQRLIVGVIIAAVAAAACVGVSFVQHILAEQRQAKLDEERARSTASQIIEVDTGVGSALIDAEPWLEGWNAHNIHKGERAA